MMIIKNGKEKEKILAGKNLNKFDLQHSVQNKLLFAVKQNFNFYFREKRTKRSKSNSFYKIDILIVTHSKSNSTLMTAARLRSSQKQINIHST